MTVVDRLRGGLIVSVQAAEGSALDSPAAIAAMAQAAVDGGAVAVRIQGIANLKATRKRIKVPILGLVKTHHPGFEPYITPTLEDIAAILATGAEIVAFDATGRRRPGDVCTQAMIAAIHAGKALAMADCATAANATHAARDGADILGTTLRSYTNETTGAIIPAIDLLKPMSRHGKFVICEGGVHRPDQVAQALAAGADAVVVGTAITDLVWRVREFVAVLDKRSTA